MKLISLYIENFGKFSNFNYNFDDKLNVICKENGWGKTTLSVFIKAMLFGLNVTNKQELDENDRKKYFPWNGGTYGGYLVVEVDGNTYRIERTFSKKATEDICVVYDLKTNKPSTKYDSNIGFDIFGINVDSFERSVYIPQKELDIEFNSDISSKLSDLIGGSTDTKSFDTAIKRLDEKAKELKRNGNKGLIAETNEKLASVEQSIDNINEQLNGIHSIDSKIEELINEIENVSKEKENINKQLDLYHISIKYKEQKKTIERMNESIKQAEKELVAFKEKFPEDVDEQTLDEIRNKIIERDSISSLIKTSQEKIKEKEEYSMFYQHGKIEEETFNSLLEICDKNTKNKVFYIIRYYIVPIILMGLMIATIILTFSNDAFKESGMGAIVSSVSLIGIVLSTRSYNKSSNKNSKHIETLKIYGFDKLDSSNVIKLKELNNSFIEYEKNQLAINEEIKQLIEKRDELNDLIATYLSKFHIEETNELKKVDEIYKAYWSIKNKKETIERLINEKQKYIEENPIDQRFENLLIDGELLKDSIKNIDSKLFELKKSKTEYEQRKYHIIASSDTLDVLISEKEELLEVIKQMKYKHNILLQTSKMLKTAQENLLSKYVKPMKDGLSKYLSLIAKNNIVDFNINTDFEVSIIEKGLSRDISYFSKGYQQLISLCMRLALIDCLYEKEKPFVILDDPFVNYDEEKLVDTTKLLKEISNEIQIVYFTCHQSRKI